MRWKKEGRKCHEFPAAPKLMNLDSVACPSRAENMEGGVSTKLATRLLSGPLSPLISGVVLLQLITTLIRDKYSNINLILFTFQSHLDGINGTEVD